MWNRTKWKIWCTSWLVEWALISCTDGFTHLIYAFDKLQTEFTEKIFSAKWAHYRETICRERTANESARGYASVNPFRGQLIAIRQSKCVTFLKTLLWLSPSQTKAITTWQSAKSFDLLCGHHHHLAFVIKLLHCMVHVRSLDPLPCSQVFWRSDCEARPVRVRGFMGFYSTCSPFSQTTSGPPETTCAGHYPYWQDVLGIEWEPDVLVTIIP